VANTNFVDARVVINSDVGKRGRWRSKASRLRAGGEDRLTAACIRQIPGI